MTGQWRLIRIVQEEQERLRLAAYLPQQKKIIECEEARQR